MNELRASVVVLMLAACGAAPQVEPAPSSEPESRVEAAPAEAPTAEAPATEAPAAEPAAEATAPSHLRWELIAEPARVSMRHLDAFRLRVVATNEGTTTESPIAHALAFTVNGESSMIADMAFTNGVSPMTWSELPPGTSERTERALGDLFEAPGTYEIAVTVEGVAHTATVVVVR